MGTLNEERDGHEFEQPQYSVKITKPFWLGVSLVTQEEYEMVMGSNPSWFSPQGNGKDHVVGMDTNLFPVEHVSWGDAVKFSQAISEKEPSDGCDYRLPTEAEWEYACRAGTTTAFHYGNSLSSNQANFDGGNPFGTAEQGPFIGQTTKVCSYQPNAFGLYDMHGNLSEWCQDWSVSDYPSGRVQDATESTNGSIRVIRGGGFDDEGRLTRSADRQASRPNDRTAYIGFRCVLVR
ncbi:MAG: formylglycine-generating enzyme family protein, partial [Planctomycetales bacterium]